MYFGKILSENGDRKNIKLLSVSEQPNNQFLNESDVISMNVSHESIDNGAKITTTFKGDKQVYSRLTNTFYTEFSKVNENQPHVVQISYSRHKSYNT